MNQDAEKLIAAWKKRNISGHFVADGTRALEKMLALIPESATIGLSGSVTLTRLGAVKALSERGNLVFDQYRPGLSREQNLDVRRQGASADYYLASANGVARSGELVFLSAFGNRSAGIANAKNVLIICGMNKLADTVEGAIRRAREYAAPLNCKRLGWNAFCLKDGVCNKTVCLFDDYKRMCCQLLIIEAEAVPGRLQVILAGENLGF